MNDQQVRRDRALNRQAILAQELQLKLVDSHQPPEPVGALFEGRLVGFFGIEQPKSKKLPRGAA